MSSVLFGLCAHVICYLLCDSGGCSVGRCGYHMFCQGTSTSNMSICITCVASEYKIVASKNKIEGHETAMVAKDVALFFALGYALYTAHHSWKHARIDAVRV